MDDLEAFWAEVLSGVPEHVQSVWSRLPESERPALLEHLARMRDDPGWHPAQHEAADAAVRIIQQRDRKLNSQPA